ncbi:MAG: DNA polymerase III subunit gamma/tau [Bacteroidales bacterium]|nr:DNA polymerase III subunit gamma/tau [Bacteroidales bacterium]
MEKFIVSARKYRPNNFLSLVGQDSIAVTLKNSIKRDQLAHAYLFCGPRGVGKTSTARIFAKTINCMNPGADLEPCGECESCLSFAQGRSYCIHELDAASNNSVDDIRLLTEKVMIPPQIGKYSVYIIDEVHMLSSAAFNAFLKTLEEPPAHAIFILATTEKHKILPTILSRCQTYDFNRISVEDIVKNISSIAKQEGVKIDLESLHVIAQKADGAMRDALTLFDQCVAFCGTEIEYASVIRNLNVLDHEYYFNIMESALCGNFAKSLLLFDEILSKGFNALYFITGLSSHLRNLLVCKDASTEKLLEMAPALAQRYKDQSAKMSVRYIYEALGHTVKCESDYRASSNQRLLVEFLLVKLAQVQQAQVAAAVAPQTAAPVQQAAPAASSGSPAAAPSMSTAAQVEVGQPEQAAAVEPAAAQQGEAKEAATATNVIAALGSKEPEVPAGEKIVKKPQGGISISSIIKKAQSVPKTQQQETVAGNELVTMEKLKEAWTKMAQTQSQYPRLATAIKQTEPILKEDGVTVVFKVGNSAQQSWIEKNSLPQLIGFLQKELNNGEVMIKVEVIEAAQQKKVPYTAYEKAEQMRKNYPQVVELTKDLDLDII